MVEVEAVERAVETEFGAEAEFETETGRVQVRCDCKPLPVSAAPALWGAEPRGLGAKAETIFPSS